MAKKAKKTSYRNPKIIVLSQEANAERMNVWGGADMGMTAAVTFVTAAALF